MSWSQLMFYTPYRHKQYCLGGGRLGEWESGKAYTYRLTSPSRRHGLVFTVVTLYWGYNNCTCMVVYEALTVIMIFCIQLYTLNIRQHFIFTVSHILLKLMQISRNSNQTLLVFFFVCFCHILTFKLKKTF